MKKSKVEVLRIVVGVDPLSPIPPSESGEVFNLSYDSEDPDRIILNTYYVHTGKLSIVSDKTRSFSSRQIDDIINLFTEMRDELKKEKKI